MYEALALFLVLRVDLIMVKLLSGSADAGHYSVAVTLANLLLILPEVVGALLFPKLSAMTLPSRKRIVARNTAIGLGLTMVVLTAIALPFSKFLITVVYGLDFAPAASSLVLLAPGIICLSANTILLRYFASIGVPRITIYTTAFALACNVILNLYLIPKQGAAGAAIASSAACALMLASSSVYMLLCRPSSDDKEAIA